MVGVFQTSGQREGRFFRVGLYFDGVLVVAVHDGVEIGDLFAVFEGGFHLGAFETEADRSARPKYFGILVFHHCHPAHVGQLFLVEWHGNLAITKGGYSQNQQRDQMFYAHDLFANGFIPELPWRTIKSSVQKCFAEVVNQWNCKAVLRASGMEDKLPCRPDIAHLPAYFFNRQKPATLPGRLVAVTRTCFFEANAIGLAANVVHPLAFDRLVFD